MLLIFDNGLTGRLTVRMSAERILDNGLTGAAGIVHDGHMTTTTKLPAEHDIAVANNGPSDVASINLYALNFRSVDLPSVVSVWHHVESHDVASHAHLSPREARQYAQALLAAADAAEDFDR